MLKALLLIIAVGTASVLSAQNTCSSVGKERMKWIQRGVAEPSVSGKKISDKDLENHIEQFLKSDEAFKDVKVEVKNGYVILEGKVPTQRDKIMLEDTLFEMKGINDVNSQLKLSHS